MLTKNSSIFTEKCTVQFLTSEFITCHYTCLLYSSTPSLFKNMPFFKSIKTGVTLITYFDQ
jgi:hypothetical protein